LSSSGLSVDVGAGVHAVIRPDQDRADGFLRAACTRINITSRILPPSGLPDKFLSPLTLEYGNKTEVLVRRSVNGVGTAAGIVDPIACAVGTGTKGQEPEEQPQIPVGWLVHGG
jgi:hypothetical protein